MKELIEKINNALNSFEEIDTCEIDNVMSDINRVFASGQLIETQDMEIITTFISRVNGSK